jgi:isopentenyl-diphosphate delta-isomerase type 1
VTATVAPGVEHVVLIDGSGRATGTAPKQTVHTTETPFHLAFSCYVVDRGGRVLLTRRAPTKRTWPSTWSNACCGHPQLGETLREAVVRRLEEELGLAPRALGVAIPDFAYRAVMADGTTEHELCPVVVAVVDGEPSPDLDEVDAVAWTTWDELRRRADTEPRTLSPWAVRQVAGLGALAPTAQDLLDLAGRGGRLLEQRIGEPEAADGVPGDGCDALAVGVAVEARLRDFVVAKALEVHELDPAVTDVTSAIAALVDRGGKRLRPAFVHWGHAATGAPPDERVTAAAAAVELLHTFALIHDDVMDRSATRRNGPSTHVALEAGCPAPSRPEAARFGTNAAVLAGDLAHLWADELLDEAGTGPAVDRARRRFHQLRTEVIAGQYLDLRLAHHPGATESEARQVALLKTARYTVTRPLQLGAALGGGPARLDAALGAYGDATGLAFQLRDDVLGLFGDPETTGKSHLDDLREGKRTLLVLRALALGDANQRSAIGLALGDPLLDEDAAARCREAVVASGALASIEALIADRYGAAVGALTHVPEPARKALGDLAAFAAYRRT